MSFNLKTLRDIALRATPGPWDWYTDGNPVDGATGFAVHSKSDTEDSRVGFDLAVMEYDQMGLSDAKHIAAFDPPTVIQLLDRIEELESELAEYRKREDKSRKRRYYGLKWSDGMIEQSGDYSYSLEEARANAKREQQSDPDGELPVIVQQIITEHTGPWVEVTDDDE